jgi:ketosteroid isomerase-like protein
MKSPQHFPTLYQKSVLEKNIEGHLKLYSTDVLIFDMWSDWQIKGLDKWSLSVKEWLGSISDDEKVFVDFSEQTIVESSEFASFSAIVKYSAVNKEGKILRFLNNRFSAVMKKENDEWKVFHQHTSAPIDHLTMKASLQML